VIVHKVLFEWVRELQALGDGGCLELIDNKGHKTSSRKEHFSLLHHMFQLLLFRNWQHMLNFIHAPPEIYAP